jgi:hypothetical protein
MCDNFANYFVDKIANIKVALNHRLNGDESDPTADDAVFHGTPLADLPPPSVDEVVKLIALMPGKSSPLDAIPTSIIKSCIDVFAPLIAHLAALSFRDGCFPTRYKTAVVTQYCFDRDNAASYKPMIPIIIIPTHRLKDS